MYRRDMRDVEGSITVVHRSTGQCCRGNCNCLSFWSLFLGGGQHYRNRNQLFVQVYGASLKAKKEVGVLDDMQEDGKNRTMEAGTDEQTEGKGTESTPAAERPRNPNMKW